MIVAIAVLSVFETDLQQFVSRVMDMSPRTPNFHGLHIRKWYEIQEEVLATEAGRLADGDPLVKIVVAAAIQNPHAGAFAESFADVIAASEPLGIEFGRRLLARLNGRAVQSYGKAAIVGTNGEYENGNAFLTTAFANPIRDAVGGALAWVPSTGKRGGPGTEIDISARAQGCALCALPL